MLGIALGIAALITVMSVMNGFQKEVRARILGVTAHVQIMGGESGLAQWQTALEAVTYTNTSATPNTANRTISFVVNDGTLASTIATKTVSAIAPISVTVQTAAGIDLRWATLYDEMANSPIGAGGSTTQYICADSGQFNGHTAAIKFLVTGTGFTYGGGFPISS